MLPEGEFEIGSDILHWVVGCDANWSTVLQANGDFIFKYSTAYLTPRPADAPANLKWPGPYDILENVAQMARLNWP